jgi:NADH dehydrogenase FAD-containing subunit
MRNAVRYVGRVVLVSWPQPGSWLSPRAQKYLRAAFDRLTIEVRSGVRVEEVKEDCLLLAGGTTLPFDGCIWAGGFRVPDLARETGLTVNEGGRVLVDSTLRSLSHPEVYAIGDAAAASGTWGECVAMGCRSGGFTGPYVADAIADRLAGRTPKDFGFRYSHECISLGRRDAVIQFLNADESPHNAILTGPLAVRYKEVVLRSATWLFNRPGPYTPRRRRLATTKAVGLAKDTPRQDHG